MKTMTCKQLGGACNKEFHANTFEKIVAMSKKHGMEKYNEGDEEHISVMNKMRENMNDPDYMKTFIEDKKKIFDELPEEK